MSANPVPILDARPFCKETLCFASVVPDDIDAGKTIALSVVQQNAGETYSAKKISSDGTETDALTVIAGNLFTAPDEGGLYAITASATNYAPWTTTVYVNPKAS
jgi:Neuraminidase (sialidase)